MTLLAVVESVDDVEEEHRSLYVERDVNGKKIWALDTSGLQAHPDVMTVKAALDRMRGEKTRLTTELATAEAKLAALPEGLDPEEFARLKHEEEERLKNPDNKPDEAAKQALKTMYEQRLVAAEEKRKVEVEALKSDLKTERDAAAHRTAKQQLSTALVEAGVERHFMTAAEALLSRDVKTRRDEETGEVEAFFETDLGEQPIAQFVETWSKSDAGKHFVPKPSGGGANGSKTTSSSDPNPWKAETFNVTNQGQIVRSDKNKAARMMKAAGLPDQKIHEITGVAAAA